MKINIIGAGLAGCEAALLLSSWGYKINLFEMKRKNKTPAQKLEGPCELVCSNSFRSTKKGNAVALLKDEMLLMNSCLLKNALKVAVAAGDCLAVDRYLFSKIIEDKLQQNKNIEIIHEEIFSVPKEGINIIATGPLTSEKLSASIIDQIGMSNLYFYDAIAPIIDAETIDNNECFWASRWNDSDTGDYLNVPLNKQEYDELIYDILASDKVSAHQFEKAQYFESCLPIEELAKRGHDALRFGPFKPVGLFCPKMNARPYAVIQLRKEDRFGQSFNMVGCQTRMSIGEQKRIFSKLKALRNAKYLRYGSIHRNTFLDSPKVLDDFLRLKKNQGSSQVFLAGQITGVEGYVESMAVGLILSYMIDYYLKTDSLLKFPNGTALRGLYDHVRGTNRAYKDNFCPSNVTWSMIPPLNVAKKIPRTQKRLMLHNMGLALIKNFKSELGI